MNDVDKVFSKYTTLLCRNNIFKNVIARWMLDVNVKDIIFKDEKKIKLIEIWKIVTDAWENYIRVLLWENISSISSGVQNFMCEISKIYGICTR